MKKTVKHAASKVADDQEKGARKTVLEELFQDFNRSRFQVYKMNFFRGIFFGFGSVLGGTVVIAILVWVLALLSNYIPALSDFFQDASDVLRNVRK
ncbi:MAG TPA: DUF5665 domain-containing protein [Patescibacteria group bacterium]|jgi:hypothetical protein|nr:DUF5665 domain-containing protein [Patescibacteria group bacterium]